MLPGRRPIPVVALALLVMAGGCGSGEPSPARPSLPLLGTTADAVTSRDALEQTVVEMASRLEADPADTPAAVRLADALLRQARVSGNAGLAAVAERHLRAAVARRPDDYAACRMLAATLASAHRFEQAVAEVHRCLPMRSDDAWIYGVLGDALLELGRRDEALDAFDRMMMLKPTAAAYARVSYAYEQQGDLESALALMQMALSAAPPQDPEAVAWHRTQLGYLHLEMGRMSDAGREFAHAAFVFPGYVPAREGHARLLGREGRSGEALTLVEQLLAEAPQPALFTFAGDLLTTLGRNADARARYALAAAAEQDGAR
jgi:tetratricopeptide (TPR) repeat protein